MGSTFSAWNNQPSKSVNKMPVAIDKEEVYREFFAYKMKCKSTGKLGSSHNKSATLDKSISNTSKGKISKGSNLIPIKTVRIAKKVKNQMNISQSEFNKSKDKIYYGAVYKKIVKDKYINLNSSSVSMGSSVKPLKRDKKSNYTKEFDAFSGNSKSENKEKMTPNSDVYDLYKVCNSCASNKTDTREDYFSTYKNTNDKDTNKDKEKDTREMVDNKSPLDHDNSKRSFIKGRGSGDCLSEVFSKVQTENYEKYYVHLNDQATFLNYKIKEYKQEKEKLLKQLEESKSDKSVYAEKLEKEIKGYRHMTDHCVKNCSQLAEEVMLLKKEINKYTSNFNGNPSSSYFFKGNNNINNSLVGKNDSFKTSKLFSSSPIRLKMNK